MRLPVSVEHWSDHLVAAKCGAKASLRGIVRGAGDKWFRAHLVRAERGHHRAEEPSSQQARCCRTNVNISGRGRLRRPLRRGSPSQGLAISLAVAAPRLLAFWGCIIYLSRRALPLADDLYRALAALPFGDARYRARTAFLRADAAYRAAATLPLSALRYLRLARRCASLPFADAQCPALAALDFSVLWHPPSARRCVPLRRRCRAYVFCNVADFGASMVSLLMGWSFLRSERSPRP
jgi:hypothetical protein